MGRTKGDLKNRFRVIRGKATQKEFAAKMGVSHRTWQYYEGGRIPPGTRLRRVAEKSGTTVDFLLGRVWNEEEISSIVKREVTKMMTIKNSQIKDLIKKFIEELKSLTV